MTSGGNKFDDFLRSNLANFVQFKQYPITPKKSLDLHESHLTLIRVGGEFIPTHTPLLRDYAIYEYELVTFSDVTRLNNVISRCIYCHPLEVGPL